MIEILWLDRKQAKNVTNVKKCFYQIIFNWIITYCIMAGNWVFSPNAFNCLQNSVTPVTEKDMSTMYCLRAPIERLGLLHTDIFFLRFTEKQN